MTNLWRRIVLASFAVPCLACLALMVWRGNEPLGLPRHHYF
jgi:hypothetical protein